MFLCQWYLTLIHFNLKDWTMENNCSKIISIQIGDMLEYLEKYILFNWIKQLYYKQ